jgi:response regulator RpfG family c-di-GMP phosphodiesterase
MNLSHEETEDLSAAALLHSLEHTDSFGNRLTTMRRTDAQSATAREHSDCEAKLLTAIPSAGNMNEIIKFYRENFDGTGPGRMNAEQIPQASRVLRVADEYDSLVQPESSVARLRHDEAMQFLLQRSGKQFDPRVIEIMSQLNPDDISMPETVAAASGNGSISTDRFEPAFVDALVW